MSQGRLSEIVYLYEIVITLRSGIVLGKVGVANDTHKRIDQYGPAVKQVTILSNELYPSRSDAMQAASDFHYVIQRHHNARYYGNHSGIENGGSEMFYRNREGIS